MVWPFQWFGNLGIAKRLLLLFLLFVASMAVAAFHLRQLAGQELADIAALQTAIEQKQQLIALQTAISDYSALLDVRQSVIASRDFRGLQALKQEISSSRTEAEEQIERFVELYSDADVDAVTAAMTAMQATQDAYLRDVVAGDVISVARRQKEIDARRANLADVIAASSSKGATDFDVIRDNLSVVSRDLSFATGLTITIMAIASLLCLALVIFSVSRPLGQLFLAIDGLDKADRRSFPRDTGPPEFRAIGRALDALAKRVRAQREAEEQLRLSEAKLRQFAECSADVFWETDSDLRYNWVQTANLGGDSSPSDILGRTRWEVAGVDPDDDPYWCRHRSDMQKHRPFRDFLYKVDTPGGGHPHWWRVNGAPIQDCDGSFVGYRGTGTDVTEQVAMTEELRRSQSRDAVSRLSGGIAHDFNNLLTVLKSNLELLEKRADLTAPSREMLARCLRATDRGSRLTTQLLTLGQRQSLKAEAIDLTTFLDEFGELISRTLPSSIRISLDTTERLPSVHADPAMLQDALLNLVINARDAMPDGGYLTIRAEPSGKHDSVTIRISDTGDGIPAAVRDKVFEPFFTTKGVGNGSGLGLSMVRGFVEQSGGSIDLESQPGLGTMITIALPLALSVTSTRSEPASRRQTLQRGEGETILVVEDDDDVRSSMEGILIYLGYGVRSCASVATALKVLEQTSASISLVISDVVMPGDLHGDDLAAIINQRYPDIPMVLMSGHALDGVRDDLKDRAIPILSKPVATEVLQQLLHEQLDRSKKANRKPSDAHSHS